MIVASIKDGEHQLGWFRFVTAPRIGEVIEIMHTSNHTLRYRVIEVLHVPMPYVHGEEPMVRETVHLTVQPERGRMVGDL